MTGSQKMEFVVDEMRGEGEVRVIWNRLEKVGVDWGLQEEDLSNFE